MDVDVNFPNQIWMEDRRIPIIPPELPIWIDADAAGGERADRGWKPRVFRIHFYVNSCFAGGGQSACALRDARGDTRGRTWFWI
ncbi:hypothetical protein [Achromobacter sp. 2789STDY5608621]|uniref:hypothetical protein n=1 Tax=Achromobacter sp. 2789STDY5608621 TaxID=1806496 RepID=UPI0018D0D1CA|nr:hypothetical protein [Achromobacter sp. 2789STDY5608621]